ncbi:MAG: DUF2490 domain-containing protein [Chitinophagaceae bacterium]|nr:DUF2490 domain-containing protein [Chitinophagaceae bacterium]
MTGLKLLCILLLTVCCVDAGCQSTTYTQFWNEFSLSRPLKGKWSIEFNLGQSWTATPPDHKSMFASNAQIYGRAWIHYYFTAKWKLSIFYAYFYNKYVPEIDQREYPESRLALQATWYIKKTRLTLLSRMRLEDRHIRNTDGYNEGVYRFRDQVKILYPLNGKRIRTGIFYGIASDELFFKSPSNVTGAQFFDRNRLTVGGGYSLTDDIQVELTYVNDYIPRPSLTEIYNALQLNFSFNNLMPNIKKLLKKKPRVN